VTPAHGPIATQPAQRRRLLSRAERRESIIEAAKRSFARNGLSATVLEDVAAESGITKTIIYRHFGSKAELYQAALDDVSNRLTGALATPGLGTGTVAALVQVAAEDPDGFRLLFTGAASEPEFRAYVQHLSSTSFAVSEEWLRDRLPDRAHREWAARLLPVLAAQSIVAWLDAGNPGTVAEAAQTVQQILRSTMSAIAANQQVH
jgi:AcrR family transcriptional regulator